MWKNFLLWVKGCNSKSKTNEIIVKTIDLTDRSLFGDYYGVFQRKNPIIKRDVFASRNETNNLFRI